MTATMTAPPAPNDYLRDARVVLAHPEALPISSWARAIAVLGRQAIEAAMADLWDAVDPEAAKMNKRAQFIYLRFVIDPELAALAHYTWGRFSEACHHHVYELPPSAGELGGWLDATNEILDGLCGGAVQVP